MSGKIEKFILFYEQQTLDERRRIREEFLQKSGLSYPAWFSKKSRKVFSALEINALEEICNTKFDA